MSDKGTTTAGMREISQLADEAQANAEIAADAMAMLSMLVINKDLNVAEDGYLDVDAYTVFAEGVDLPDSVRNVERCERNVQDVATVIGNSLYRSIEHAAEGPQYWKK